MRVIADDGSQLGVMTLPDALARAQELGLDLVEIAPAATPPVCRIMDYSKFKYEQEKKEKEARKKQKVVHLKEVRLGPKIGEHDYQFKLRNLEDFLKRGDKVKVSMMFRGREMAHQDIGRKVFDRLASDISGIGEIEEMPSMMGNILIMVIKAK